MKKIIVTDSKGDPIGTLEIPEALADVIAAVQAKGLGVQLNGAVNVSGDKPELLSVWIGGVPADKPVS